MNYLLDTHVLLWAMFEPHKLSRTARELLTGDDSLKFISIVTMWELAIKNRIGKLALPIGIHQIFLRVEQMNVGLVGVDQQDIEMFNTLPLLHRDPFDGILISSAIAGNMTIITADENIHKYDVHWIW